MPLITSALDRVRLELGDTDTDNALFSDDEILTYLDDRGGSDWRLAAADLCDVLATRFAGSYDFKWKDGSFNRSQMAKMYADRAQKLRNRAGGGLGVIQTTKVDGYSEDISSRDGAGEDSPTGRVRAGYRDPDLRR